MRLSNGFEKWLLSGLAVFMCASAHAECPTPLNGFESVSQFADTTETLAGNVGIDKNSSFLPKESYAALSAEERQNFSDRMKDLRSLAKDRTNEAKALDDELAQPGNCGDLKTKRGCISEQVIKLKAAGKDPSALEQLLNRPSIVRQSAAQLNEISDAGDNLRSHGSLADSLKDEASGVYATFRDSWKYMIRKEPLIAITVGMAGYFAAKPFADRTSAHFNDPKNKWTGAKYQIGNELGQGYTILAPVWLAAKISGNQKLTQVADDWMAGGIMDGLISLGLKHAVHERRPDGSDNQGFPSGHTMTAFMMAKIVQDEMGSKWGIPAYVLASYVGMSRIGGAKHTPGEVVAGAGLGYAIGSAVTQYRSESEGRMNGQFRVGDTKVEYQAVPAVTTSGPGMAVVGQF